MTDTGYKNLVDMILRRTIDPPKNKTAQELQEWMNGYLTCQQTVLRIIKEVYGG